MLSLPQSPWYRRMKSAKGKLDSTWVRRSSQGAHNEPVHVGGRAADSTAKIFLALLFVFIPSSSRSRRNFYPSKGAISSTSPFPPPHPAKPKVSRDD